MQQILVKLGAQGSMLVSADRVLRQSAIPVSQVVDTTAAGDAFTAAYVVAILEGNSEKDALGYAGVPFGLISGARVDVTNTFKNSSSTIDRTLDGYHDGAC